MIEKVRSWFSDTSLLVFLVGQGIAIGAAVISLIIYMTTLETRVATLEIRGSPHLAEINNRLTVLERSTEDNKRRLERVIDIMTKELHIGPVRP
jgi:uncharacterized coiled-coil protein SlyX